MGQEREVKAVVWGAGWIELLHDGPPLDYGDRFTAFGVTRRITGFMPSSADIPDREGTVDPDTGMRRVNVLAQEEGRPPQSMLLRDVKAYMADRSRPPLRWESDRVEFKGREVAMTIDYYLPD